jgi:hypothetical protein
MWPFSDYFDRKSDAQQVDSLFWTINNDLSGSQFVFGYFGTGLASRIEKSIVTLRICRGTSHIIRCYTRDEAANSSRTPMTGQVWHQTQNPLHTLEISKHCFCNVGNWRMCELRCHVATWHKGSAFDSRKDVKIRIFAKTSLKIERSRLLQYIYISVSFSSRILRWGLLWSWSISWPRDKCQWRASNAQRRVCISVTRFLLDRVWRRTRAMVGSRLSTKMSRMVMSSVVISGCAGKCIVECTAVVFQWKFSAKNLKLSKRYISRASERAIPFFLAIFVVASLPPKEVL